MLLNGLLTFAFTGEDGKREEQGRDEGISTKELRTLKNKTNPGLTNKMLITQHKIKFLHEILIVFRHKGACRLTRKDEYIGRCKDFLNFCYSRHHLKTHPCLPLPQITCWVRKGSS